jgi:hypothetical protein
MNDAPCFQTCLKAAGLGKRDAMGEQFGSTIPTKRGLSSRAITLNCVGNENCYKFTDGSLLCLNLGTGMFYISALSQACLRRYGTLTVCVARFISR